MAPLRWVQRGLRPLRGGVTPLGRALIVVAFGAWSVQRGLGWLEFGVLALVAVSVLILALLLIWIPQPARAHVSLVPTRVTAGEPATARVALGARWMPLLSPTIRIDVAGRTRSLRLPWVPPGRERAEDLALPVLPRGVHVVGPVIHERTDPLGLLRRRTVRAERRELLVRPVLTRVPALDPGLINDLDGAPSRHAAASDLAFHTLREYVPGDDLRHVHWRSSAKADTLLMRQYVETRRSRATVLLDHGADSYAGDAEFEVAVSVVASLAVRALRDDFEVDLVCGPVHVASRSPDTVLDACCRIAATPKGPAVDGAGDRGDARGADFVATARRAGTYGAGSSLVVVVSGSRCDPAVLRMAGAQFPADALRVLVQVDLSAASGVGTAAGFRPMVVGRLSDLSALMVGSGVSR
jgi:uncharacterized protein (DUF58 family)